MSYVSLKFEKDGPFVALALNPFDVRVDRERGLVIVKEGPDISTVGPLSEVPNVPERIGVLAAQKSDVEILERYDSHRGHSKAFGKILEKLKAEELDSLSRFHGVQSQKNKTQAIEALLKVLGVQEDKE